MRVHLWAMGAPSDDWVARGESLYVKRIERYMPFEYKTQLVTKGAHAAAVLEAEGQWMERQLDQVPTRLILLDERGKAMTSPALASKLEAWRQGTQKRVVFLIGSAYGFHPAVREKAHEVISLSAMTLPHQLVRLVMLEQLYRACTILRGESYHHE
jgi:23S rRNA (pseudouridine1915-N3)-methyltransferase